MKPEQFICDYGVDKAREVVEGAPDGATHYGLRQYRQWESQILKTFTEGSWRSTAVFGGNLRFIEDDCLCIQDLKRLMESLDEIESYGGIELFKEYVNGVALMLCGIRIHPEVKRLDRILKDHESIYGGGDEVN